MPLTDTDRELLRFEQRWFQHAGNKERAVREEFDLSMTAYWHRLNALIDTEEALAAEPLVVKRLRRIRAQRQRSRSARRIGFDL